MRIKLFEKLSPIFDKRLDDLLKILRRDFDSRLYIKKLSDDGLVAILRQKLYYFDPQQDSFILKFNVNQTTQEEVLERIWKADTERFDKLPYYIKSTFDHIAEKDAHSF